MSQYGAQGMALANKKYDEILNYYYKNTKIVKNQYKKINLFKNNSRGEKMKGYRLKKTSIFFNIYCYFCITINSCICC